MRGKIEFFDFRFAEQPVNIPAEPGEKNPVRPGKLDGLNVDDMDVVDSVLADKVGGADFSEMLFVRRYEFSWAVGAD